MQQETSIPIMSTVNAAAQDKQWDSDLAAMLDSGVISGYALLSHRGDPIAAHGALQSEFAPRAASDAVPPALVMLQLFDPRADAANQCTAFTLCGVQHQVLVGWRVLEIHIWQLQVFCRQEAAVWATGARRLAACCAYNLGFGILCVAMQRGQQLQHVVFSTLDAACRRLQK